MNKKLKLSFTAGLALSAIVMGAQAFAQTPRPSNLPQPSGQPGMQQTCQGVNFNTTLSMGANSNEVRCLQTILNQNPNTQVAQSGPGSKGRETNYFGPMTRRALIKFQEQVGLSATGSVGPQTREAFNRILSGGNPAPSQSPPTQAPTRSPAQGAQY